MDFAACTTGFGFDDPQPDAILSLVSTMRERIEGEELHKSLQATDMEKRDSNLKRFLTKHFYDIEVALTQWHGWVKWRHKADIDGITDDQIAYERKEGTVVWRGKNKEGMLCCVITGRLLDPINRRGTPRSFRRYLLKVLDEGLQQADEMEETKVCIIYDRRGLEFRHIDPNLYQFCKGELEQMRDWYGDRVGALYVLHTNWIFWLLYHTLLRPLSAVWTSMDKLRVLDTPQDLLAFFDEDQLFLVSPEVTCDTALAADNNESSTSAETTADVGSDSDDEATRDRRKQRMLTTEHTTTHDAENKK